MSEMTPYTDEELADALPPRDDVDPYELETDDEFVSRILGVPARVVGGAS